MPDVNLTSLRQLVILARSSPRRPDRRLDWTYVASPLGPFVKLKEDREILARPAGMREQV